jgi:hypothetical protein
MDRQEQEINAIDQPLPVDSALRTQGLKILAVMIARRHCRPPKDFARNINNNEDNGDSGDVNNGL